MRNWITALFLLGITSLKAQDISLNGYLSWFSKVDAATVKSAFQPGDFRLVAEQDSAEFRVLKYTLLTDVNQPSYTFLMGDSSLTSLTIENFSPNVHKTFISQLKANKFKNLGADVNGDFITTSYDNGTFIFNQDFEMVDHPAGKGQIPHYRYRIVRKNGVFDALNGAKKKTETINGKTYTIIENYKNGVLEGERITYFPGDSVVKKKENYRGGRLNGMVSDFDEKGQLIHSSVHSYHWKYGMEKWYARNGKLMRSLQWQRDVPVGTDKFFVEGFNLTGPAYKNGMKQGTGTVPMSLKWNGKHDETNSAIPEEVDWGNITAEDFYLNAYETVQFVNGLKNGKAIGFSVYHSDTLYIAYYKNGLLDSIFKGYQHSDSYFGYTNEPRFTTYFLNGLENGNRTFYVMSGPDQGKVSYFETYRNGTLDGETVRFYRKSDDVTIPPTDPEENPWSSHPNKYVPGEWVPEYSLMTYKAGILNGPFHFQKDSMNYSIGTYTDGKLDGKNDAGMVFGKQRVKIVRHYDKGINTGEWTTKYLPDSVVITQNYLNNKKHGIFSKSVKGKLVEERNYASGYLYEITTFDDHGYNKFTIVTNEVPTLYVFKQEEKFEDQYHTYNFTADVPDYPATDTTLILLRDAVGKVRESSPRLDGKYEIRTPNFVENGTYSDNKLTGVTVVEHKNAGVYEHMTYENGVVTTFSYTHTSTGEAFSGTFISAVSGNSISVKDGVRHGWYIEYDQNGTVIRKTKYVKGVAKKTIENSKKER